MHRVLVLAALGLASSSCYTRPAVGDSDTAQTDPGETQGDSSASSSDGPSTTNPSSTAATLTSGSPSTATDGTDDTVDPDDSTGTTELGPRIVMSIPADGDGSAPLNAYFMLYFDRVVGVNDAVGKISVSQDGGPAAIVSPVACPPDADPTCIAGLFPESFYGDDGLPPNTPHTITVAADFPDPDGMVNTVDQVVEFTTFDFTADFFDDSDVLSEEVGGLAYDAASESLFVVGLGSDFGDPQVRRIPIPGGVAGAASTAASPISNGGGPYAYGIDTIEGDLYVSMSYSGDVRRYTNLSNPTLDGSEVLIGETTGLAAPNDTLLQVQSVARASGNLLFGRGYFLATDPAYEILGLSAAGGFSIIEDGSNLWDDSDFYGMNLTAGTVDGNEMMFVAAGTGIFKFRVADGQMLGSIEPEYGTSYADLHLDANGHLFVGSDSGVYVYDAVSDELDLVVAREGLEASRIALREDGDTVYVYYLRFREDARIGVVPISF